MTLIIIKDETNQQTKIKKGDKKYTNLTYNNV